MSSGPHPSRHPTPTGEMARHLAGLALVVLVAAAVLLVSAWAIGGENAVSDNWVGVSVVVGLFTGLIGSLVALGAAVVAGLRHEPWSRLWLPLTTFPAVAVVVVLLEVLVIE
jgi:hypothetical protein